MPRAKIDGDMTSFKLGTDLRVAILDEFGKQGVGAYLRGLVRKDMEARGRVPRHGFQEPQVSPPVEVVILNPDPAITAAESASPRKRRSSHGLGPFMTDHPSYRPWRSMIAKSSETGVSFDPAWNHFWTFARDLGPKPPGAVLMRHDQTLPWRPGNCSWATRREVNHRRNVVPSYTVGGKTMTLPEWAELSGVPYATLYARVAQAGRPIEEAIKTPVAPGPGRPRPRTSI